MEKQPLVIKDIFMTNVAQLFGCNYKAIGLFAYEWGIFYTFTRDGRGSICGKTSGCEILPPLLLLPFVERSSGADLF